MTKIGLGEKSLPLFFFSHQLMGFMMRSQFAANMKLSNIYPVHNDAYTFIAISILQILSASWAMSSRFCFLCCIALS